ETAADAEERGQDRQPHRQQRAERHQEDDDGGADTDELTRELGLLGKEVAAELDLQTRLVDLLPEGADRLPALPVLLVSRVGEIELGVGDRAVLRDLVGVLWIVRTLKRIPFQRLL